MAITPEQIRLLKDLAEKVAAPTLKPKPDYDVNDSTTWSWAQPATDTLEDILKKAKATIDQPRPVEVHTDKTLAYGEPFRLADYQRLLTNVWLRKSQAIGSYCLEQLKAGLSAQTHEQALFESVKNRQKTLGVACQAALTGGEVLTHEELEAQIDNVFFIGIGTKFEVAPEFTFFKHDSICMAITDWTGAGKKDDAEEREKKFPFLQNHLNSDNPPFMC